MTTKLLFSKKQMINGRLSSVFRT